MKMEVESIISQDFDESEVDICNVFVKYLPCNFNEADLHELFEKYGEIVNTKVMVNIKTGNSLGYGFVRFSNPEDAQEAIKHMNRHQIGYKTLLCKLSKPSNSPPVSPYPNGCSHEPSSPTSEQQREPSNTLYVRVLSPTITDAILKQTFCQFGEVAEAQVLIDTNSGKSKRAGVIRFSNIQHSINALQNMSGSLILGETPLVVKYAPNKKQIQQIPHLSLSGSTSSINSINGSVSPTITSSPSMSSISSSSSIQQSPQRSPSPQPLPIPPQHSSSPQPLPIPPQRSSSPQPQPIPQVPQYTYIYQNEPYSGYYTQEYNSNTYPNSYYPQIYSNEPIIISSSPNSSPPIYQVHHAPAPANWSQNESNYYIYHHPQTPQYYYHHHHHPQQPTIVYSLPQTQPQPHHSPSNSPQISPRERSSKNTNNINAGSILICTYKGTLENSYLINIFSKYGDLKSINININPNNGKSKCFVTFNNIENALVAQQNLDNTRIGSQFIRVKFLTVN
ncbi:hypothetical protein DICPUDRAFT_41462 [Dictyostelium purpureum]|uniref:RRM domain-containing protein n=1 Tax=Dictyostelium purpureum TaxID=5786 RepID=F1A062_DICPU|nr:uncharacterized protein DICPUDRAFT_41462 [Dictyostelium purpureum]EGC30411.1 hypothetical protein DICPUDRAFT_41462 [Dictyostelium purpureum]|eukprot:XP_003293056.1 hypothetical protein DICPUDRAFT_41462 [Dictyostelium purpureum]